MTHNLYTQERDQLFHRFNNLRDFSFNEQLNGQLALAGATLSNFLPGIDASLHPALFAELIAHKKLSTMEQGRVEALDYLAPEGPVHSILPRLRQGPSIICTFHMGSYRLLNLFLGINAVPVTLVAGNAIIEQEGIQLQSIFREVTGNELSVIDASAPASGFRILRELKKGRCLVFYIDGNTGAGESTRDNNNSCIVPFLAGEIHARKGVATLAAHAGVPVFPVVCYRPSLQEIRLRFFEPVQPSGPADDSQATVLTRHLYQLAEPIINLYPAQWEAWLYLHKTAVTGKNGTQFSPVHIAGSRYQLDRNRFTLLRMGKKHFLMRKNTYTSFEIEKYLYNLLQGSNQEPIMPSDLEKTMILPLLREQVLIKFKNNCIT